MYQDGFFVISMLPIAPTARRPCRTRTDISSFQDYLLNDIAVTVFSMAGVVGFEPTTA